MAKHELTQPANRGDRGDEFEGYTQTAIDGILFIRSLPDRSLLEALENKKSNSYLYVKQFMPDNTNPNWIEITLAKTAYDRGFIDEVRLDSYL